MIRTTYPLPCHPESLKLATVAFEGNVVPLSWLQHIRFDSGQPDLNAIMLLADIVYWYRPVAVRDEASGTFIGYRQKFHHDLLRKSYQQYADLFGLSKRQVTDAIVRLEKLGLVQRVFRTLQTEVAACSNILFIALHADEVIRITTAGRKYSHSHLERSSITDTTASSFSTDVDDRDTALTLSSSTPFEVQPDGQTSPTSGGQVLPTNGIGIPVQRDTIIDKEITAQSSAFSPQTAIRHQQDLTSTPLPEREVVKTLVALWNTTLDDPAVTAISTYHPRLRSLFVSTFNNDLTQWQAFCTRVATTPFLRGHGPNFWKADLKWCLSPLNLQNILQGRYDRCVGYVPVATTVTAHNEQAKHAELLTHIDAITDPLTQRFQRALLTSVTTSQYQHWFRDLVVDRLEGSTGFIKAPNHFIKTRCQQQYETTLLTVLKSLFVEIKHMSLIATPQWVQNRAPPEPKFEDTVLCFDRLTTASSIPNPLNEGRAL